MAKKEKRFLVLSKESMGLSEECRVLVDTRTGVQYLYVSCGYGGGLTPLLDAEGKPMLAHRTGSSDGPEL